MIGVAYGFSWGLQQMIIFDFHESRSPCRSWPARCPRWYAAVPRAAAAWALPLVFVKEDQGLTVAAIGLVMIALAAGAGVRRWRERRCAPTAGLLAGRALGAGAGRGDMALPLVLRGWRRGGGPVRGRGGAVLVVWGLGWSALAIAVIIPHFNPAHHYMYWSDGGVISPGGGHISARRPAGPAHRRPAR